MKSSVEISELAKALAAAQKEITPALKESTNPFFHSKYADLASVWTACREPLNKNGLCVTQTCTIEKTQIYVVDEAGDKPMRPVEINQLCLETILMHISGQWISSLIPLKPVKEDPQGLGSAISYMRRYSLAAIVGVIQEDDDGNMAT